MSELFVVAGFSFLTLMLLFYVLIRSQKLVDRMSDKVMSFASPQAFATYATTTPTAQEAEVGFRGPSNGKSSGKVLAGYPGEFSLPDNLEPI